ncbi:Asp-tRNA(Asn)/Glu-tRNA(Gln) amidotransferase subunit GatB [Candidatus Peregrinibacteria bacterium]|nr:Asp-tRNA(Asn)/Glu-tRNA(Gln) amidotransferase subunit GatB [Candidatus Peregrinibacteria bacterium]
MQFIPVIGLEVHARIKTKSKMFCRCNNDIFNAEPNTHVCSVCMGFPGMLPVVNEEAVKKGVKTALALNCTIPAFAKFDRKSYFYPDLPKGFQISQYDKPISEKGSLSIVLKDGQTKRIRITRLHLEDDAGKLTHDAGGTLVDFNRSGMPLMEIVSEPDLSSVEEASLYARALQKILRTVGSSDCDMEKGMMRFDINVNLKVKKDDGTETATPISEVKNLNSFRSMEKAIAYEVKRQEEAFKKTGITIKDAPKTTLGWDDEKEISTIQREKEEAADYRYFPEPDIPPLTFTRGQVEALRKELPELPDAKAERYQKNFKLTPNDAMQLVEDPALAAYFETVARVSESPQKASNWVISELLGRLNAEGKAIESCSLSAENLGKLVKLIGKNIISGKIAKDVFAAIYEKNLDPEPYIEKQGLKQVSDIGELEKICQQVLDRNPKILEDFRAGKDRAFGALVGQVMAATKGQANPGVVNQILKKLIE